MLTTDSRHGDPPADGSQSSEADQKTLIVTIFHRNRLHQEDPRTEHANENDFDLSIPNVVADMQIPHFELDREDFLRLTKPAEHISRLTLKIPQSLPLNLAAYRHHQTVTDFEREHAVEIIFDLCPTFTPNGERPLKLALFDMDSTLINEEVIDELARSIGISDAVSAITARAMNGDIDFATSLKERVAMLKGVPTTVWEDLKKSVTIAEGAKELIAGLKHRGVFTGVVSGGFTPMAEWLKGELGLDVAIANHLLESAPTKEFPVPHLSGQLDPDFPIVTPELKKSTLLQLSAERSIPLSETLAVGDGSNDLLMLGAAGLGIAWNAKAKVQVAAPMRLNGGSLAELLYLFGPDMEVGES